MLLANTKVMKMSENTTPAEEYEHTNNELVSTGKNNQITSFKINKFQYTALGMIIIYRLLNNRDLKILITSRGSTTGTGKTTLAIQLCQWIRRVSNDIFDVNREWNAKDHAYLNAKEYLDGYKNSNPGDPLLADEIENYADKRRSMSSGNLEITQAWAILRYKNVVSIGTAPTTSFMDKRLPELADIWINVVFPGRANTYYLTTDDFTHDEIRKRLKRNGFRESILWKDLDNNNEDYQYLKDQKEDMGIPGIDGGEDITESDVNEAERNAKRDVVIEAIKKKEKGKDPFASMTQATIGDLVGYSQQNVAKIKREAFS